MILRQISAALLLSTITVFTQPIYHPGGTNTTLQYNNRGFFGGSSKLRFDSASSTLFLGDPATYPMFRIRNGTATNDWFLRTQNIVGEGGVIDQTIRMGWNADLLNTSEPSWFWQLEHDFAPSATPGERLMEFFLNYYPTNAAGVLTSDEIRPFMIQVSRTNRVVTGKLRGNWSIGDGTNSPFQVTVSPNNTAGYSNYVQIGQQNATGPRAPLDIFHTGDRNTLALGGDASGGTNSANLAFYAQNASLPVNYGRIRLAVDDGAAGSEDGHLEFDTATNGVLKYALTIRNERLGIRILDPQYALSAVGRVQVTDATTGSGGSDGSMLWTDAPDTYLYNYETGSIYLGTAATARWQVSSTGHLLAGADSTYDIGASGATRPRHLYLAGDGTAPVTTVSTITTGDDPVIQTRQARAVTTDATITTVQTIAISASTSYLIEARGVARRTGGTAGTADDGAVYIRRALVTTKTGTVTINAVQDELTQEDQVAWNFTMSVSGANVIVTFAGAADNNVTIHVTTLVQLVGS